MPYRCLIVVFLCIAGCGRDSGSGPQSATTPDESAQKAGTARRTDVLTDRELQLVEFILRRNPTSADDRIYFLTTTPMDDWSEGGGWDSLPEAFHERIADLPANYRRASEATYEDGAVYEKSSHEQAWMEWITIKRWISETEVEVEEGVWCCPLGGGAATNVYERVEGGWRLKETGPAWVS